jgi:hypothetical protein
MWASAVCVAAAAFAGFLQHLRWLFVAATAMIPAILDAPGAVRVNDRSEHPEVALSA